MNPYKFVFYYWRWALAAVVILGIGIAAVYGLGSSFRWLEAVKAFIFEPDQSPWLFAAVLFLLPLVGFPMSVFCLAAGTKFGLSGGLAAIGAVILAHLVVCYWLVRSYFKVYLARLLDNRGYRVPQVSHQRKVAVAVAFLVVPVIPYMVKNVILAMTELHWWQYLSIAWAVQFIYAIPLVAVSHVAVSPAGITAPVLAVVGLVLIAVVVRWARRQGADQLPDK